MPRKPYQTGRVGTVNITVMVAQLAATPSNHQQADNAAMLARPTSAIILLKLVPLPYSAQLLPYPPLGIYAQSHCRALSRCRALSCSTSSLCSVQLPYFTLLTRFTTLSSSLSPPPPLPTCLPPYLLLPPTLHPPLPMLSPPSCL